MSVVVRCLSIRGAFASASLKLCAGVVLAVVGGIASEAHSPRPH